MASLPAAVRSGLLWPVRLLVVRAHRVRRSGVVTAHVAVHRGVGPVGRLGEGVLEVAQAFGREIEGFHVRAEFPQSPQRLQVHRLAAAGPLRLVVALGVGRLGREQLLGQRCLLVGDDVVRPAPHGGDGGGAQLLPHHHSGQDGALVLERDAGYLTLPRVLARGLGFGRLAGIGWGLPVRVGSGSGWAASGGEAGQGPPGGVEAIAGLQAAYGLRAR
ncbi:hypothetical protein ACH4GE_34415 [Streptomyces tendae]|uniref:hypothetical protein n=1 Tax=Streptomyces tendae TaxID=1932 RepID=UPI003795C223